MTTTQTEPNSKNGIDRSQGSSPPSITLPKGGGAIRGIGEKFAANPTTGTGSMTVPIATSPGRSGFGPQLSLSYDSGAVNSPASGANEWVLPKGHVEAAEDARETAARELREEAGVVAGLICSVGNVEFQMKSETVRARFFLMEQISETSAIERRKIGWVPFHEALTRATHDETKQLLRGAEALRKQFSRDGPHE